VLQARVGINVADETVHIFPRVGGKNGFYYREKELPPALVYIAKN
jgi:hypothetical protein